METEEVVRSLASGLRPVRRLRPASSRAALWCAFAVLCVAVGTSILGPGADLLPKMGNPQFWLQNAVLLLAFFLSATIAFHMSVPGSEPAPGARALPLWALIAWGCMLAAGTLASPMKAAQAAGWLCVSRTALLALVPALVAFFMLRRAAPTSPGWTGCAALLSAVSLAIVGMQLVCARSDSWHVFVWHFLPATVFTLAGVLLGRRFLVT